MAKTKKKTPAIVVIPSSSSSSSYLPTIAPSPILDNKKRYANLTQIILEYQDLIEKTIPAFERELLQLKEKMKIFVFKIETPKDENKKKFTQLLDAVVKMHFKISGLYHTQFSSLERKIQRFEPTGTGGGGASPEHVLTVLEKEKNDNVLPPFNDFTEFVRTDVFDFLKSHINDVKAFYTNQRDLKVQFTKWLSPSAFDPIRDVIRNFYFLENRDDLIVTNPMDEEYPEVHYLNPAERVRYYGLVSPAQLQNAKVITFVEFEAMYEIKENVKFSYDRVKDDDKLKEEIENEEKINREEQADGVKRKRKKTRKVQKRMKDLRLKYENGLGAEETKEDHFGPEVVDDDEQDDVDGAGGAGDGPGGAGDDEGLAIDLAEAEAAVEGLRDEINLNADLKGNIFQKYNHFNFTSQQVERAITLITTRRATLTRRVIAELTRRNLLPDEPDINKLIDERPSYVLKVLTKSYADKKQFLFHVPLRTFNFFRDWSTAREQNDDDYATYLPVLMADVANLPANPQKQTWIDNLTTKTDVSDTIKEIARFGKEQSRQFLIREDMYLFLKFKELKIDLANRQFYYETDKHQKFIYVPTDRRQDIIREFNQRPNVRGLGIYKVYLAICDEYIGITEKDVRSALTSVADRNEEDANDDGDGGAGGAESVDEILENLYATRHYQLTKQTYKQINSPVLATSPNFKWSIDLIDIGYYELEYKYLLTVIDIFSKRCWIEKMKKKESLEMFYAFLRVLYRASTFPHQIMCDNGGEFQSYLKNFCEVDEDFQVYVQMEAFTKPNDITLVQKPFIKIINTLSYSPRSNGLVENLNNTVRKFIRRMVTRHGNNKDWIERKNLLEIENVKNNMKNVSTKFSPDQLWTTQPYMKKEDTELNLLDHVENDLQRKARMRLKSRAKRILSINPEFQVGDIVRVKLSTLNSKIRQAIKNGDRKNLNRAFSDTLFKVKSKIESRKKQRNTMYTLDNAITGERLGRQVFSNSNAVLKAKTEANEQHYRRIFGDEMLLVIPEETTTEGEKTDIIDNVRETLLRENPYTANVTRKSGESNEHFTRRLHKSKTNFLKDLDYKVDPKSRPSETSFEHEDEQKAQKKEELKKKKAKEAIKADLDDYEATKESSKDALEDDLT